MQAKDSSLGLNISNILNDSRYVIGEGDPNATLTGLGDFLKFVTAFGQPGTSNYLDSYELKNEEYGTVVSVVVDGAARVIDTNSLPDHATGAFPNDGNPNTISPTHTDAPRVCHCTRQKKRFGINIKIASLRPSFQTKCWW